jgi:integrase
LEWQDIDFDAETITVRQTLTWIKNHAGGSPRNVPQFTAPKTESSRRTFHIPQPALVALRRQQDRIGDLERMATVSRWKPIPGHDLVFPSSTGGPLNSSNVTNRLASVLNDLGLPHQRFHDLRHLTAALLLAEGADIFTVKGILGHSQISLTANTYGHLTEKLSKTAAAQIGGALRESAPIINPDPLALGDTTEEAEVEK